MRALSVLPAAALGVLLATSATAQIVISEINFTPQNASDDVWIELTNTTANPVDISSWSIYYATKTPGQAGNYWFGLPPGTSLPAAGFLRVHWLAPVKASTATDVWTGNTVYHFLFGYLAEPLLRAGGALALISSQDNVQMNNPTQFIDWVGWGSGGFPRESLAVQAGLWKAGDFVGTAGALDSIALIYDQAGEPTPSSAFFHDATPTPLAHNHPFAGTASYGTACSLGVVNAPSLSPLSIATEGNRDFGIRVSNTAIGESVFLLFSAGQGTGSLTFGPCTAWIDPTAPLVAIGVNGQPVQTDVAIPLLVPGVAGGTIYLQAVTLVSPIDFGLSEGLTINLGA